MYFHFFFPPSPPLVMLSFSSPLHFNKKNLQIILEWAFRGGSPLKSEHNPGGCWRLPLCCYPITSQHCLWGTGHPFDFSTGVPSNELSSEFSEKDVWLLWCPHPGSWWHSSLGGARLTHICQVNVASREAGGKAGGEVPIWDPSCTLPMLDHPVGSSSFPKSALVEIRVKAPCRNSGHKIQMNSEIHGQPQAC